MCTWGWFASIVVAMVAMPMESRTAETSHFVGRRAAGCQPVVDDRIVSTERLVGVRQGYGRIFFAERNFIPAVNGFQTISKHFLPYITVLPVTLLPVATQR